MSVSLLSMPVFLGPSWHPRTKAANMLASLLNAQHGAVEVKALKSFYRDNPDLKLALGGLVAFCRIHPSFVYTKGCMGTPALLSLSRGVLDALPGTRPMISISGSSPSSHEVGEVVADEVDDVYRPRWMSRVVLKQQALRQSN